MSDRAHSGGVQRALAVLTVGAFFALAVDVLGSGRSVVLLVPGAAFLVLATAGFAWVTRAHRPAVAYGYIAVLLGLGMTAFGVAGPSTGSTLLLVVLASQSVLLLPTPAAVVVVALIPLVHVGMPFTQGLREILGALPRTDWLPASIHCDAKGFVLTGQDLTTTDPAAGRDRPPRPLETSLPGVFAAGDVRHGSVKRVASAVGEGGISIRFVHEYLAHLLDATVPEAQ